MAQAEKTERVIEESIQLTLTMEEAAALKAVTQCIGGTSSGTARGLTDAIGEALFSAGVSNQSAELYTTHDSIYFDEGSREKLRY